MAAATKPPAAETGMVTNTAYMEVKHACTGVHETLYDNDTEGAPTRVNHWYSCCTTKISQALPLE